MFDETVLRDNKKRKRRGNEVKEERWMIEKKEGQKMKKVTIIMGMLKGRERERSSKSWSEQLKGKKGNRQNEKKK